MSPAALVAIAVALVAVPLLRRWEKRLRARTALRLRMDDAGIPPV